jgi:prephenate dehydrogenase
MTPGASGDDRVVLAILGTGLMGGSLGLACRKRGLAERVIGYDVRPDRLQRALERGAITEAATSPQEAVAEATLTVIAAPVSSISGVFAQIAGHLPPGAIVTDVGSTKSRVVEDLQGLAPAHVHFIGGHPIAGSEHEGIEAADADLYTGAFWILTPTRETDTAAYGRLVRFLRRLDAHVLSLDPGRHDELVALTSHLPQLLSSTLMGFAADIAASEGGLPLVHAGGFRDMTRIAGSSPDLWVDIVRENRRAVLELLDRFQGALAAAGGYVEAGDWEALRRVLAGAREGRRRLPEKPGLTPASLVELRVVVLDHPGALAAVTTTVGEAGVNIEDFYVVHSPEGGKGTIHLTLNGEPAARAAREALEKKGFSAEITES